MTARTAPVTEPAVPADVSALVEDAVALADRWLAATEAGQSAAERDGVLHQGADVRGDGGLGDGCGACGHGGPP